MMEKLPFDELPASSVPVQVTVFVPRAKVLPEAGEQLKVTDASTISEAEAENGTVAPADPVASTVMFAGRFNVGGVVS